MLDKIKNEVIKLSNNSITVVNADTGKTKHVITGIETFKTMSFRDQCEWNMKWHKQAIKCGGMPLDRMVFYKNQWYFLDGGHYIPEFITESDYATKTIAEAKEKLENAKNSGVIFITVKSIVDRRKIA